MKLSSGGNSKAIRADRPDANFAGVIVCIRSPIERHREIPDLELRFCKMRHCILYNSKKKSSDRLVQRLTFSFWETTSEVREIPGSNPGTVPPFFRIRTDIFLLSFYLWVNLPKRMFTTTLYQTRRPNLKPQSEYHSKSNKTHARLQRHHKAADP